MQGIKKLIKVDGSANNNKYYEMYPQEDGTFLVKWGRVEGGKGETQSYPGNLFERKYKEKIRKGYKDVTDFIAIKSSAKFVDIADSKISSLISTLQGFSNTAIKENYTVSANAVTQKQVDEAQKLLNDITDCTEVFGNKRVSSAGKVDTINVINEQLEDLFVIIPRKMKKVSDHLINKKLKSKELIESVNKIISEEQATLDVMRGQVITRIKEVDTDGEKLNVLQAMGLDLNFIESGKEIDNIIRHLGDDKQKFEKAYKVINRNTQSKFDLNLNEAVDKTTKLFWHGSRNENWWSILNSGLILRPTNAVISGKMFGYGLYFADKARKSIGYTSLSGSYWAGGNSKKAYLAVFVVHTGTPWHVKRHTYDMSNLTWDSLRQKGSYDSLFAEGGIDLRNNEYIVYKENQCTIKYLVEIKS